MFIPPPIGAARPRNFDVVRSLDDFQRELAHLSQCASQLRPDIAAISKDMAQPRPALEDGFHDRRRAVTVLNVGGVDDEADQQTEHVDDDIALASHDLLAGVKTTYSAAFGGLDRLAVNDAALGDASRPSLFRAAITAQGYLIEDTVPQKLIDALAGEKSGTIRI